MGDPHSDQSRIFLSPPHMSGQEQARIGEAFDCNYISPLGPQLAAFERAFAEYTGFPHCAALSSGTAALHLALRVLGAGPGDVVIGSSLTFIASVAPAAQSGCELAFIDADEATWNMDPDRLAEITLRPSSVRRHKLFFQTISDRIVSKDLINNQRWPPG